MSARLYVGNIPFTAGEDDLRELFGQFGEISSVYIVSDRATGRPRGFAFVEMANAGDAQKAIEQLDQNEFQGRRLAVNEARPREPRPGPSPGDDFRGGRREPRW
jgi:RNA recognition motif-containing protein